MHGPIHIKFELFCICQVCLREFYCFIEYFYVISHESFLVVYWFDGGQFVLSLVYLHLKKETANYRTDKEKANSCFRPCIPNAPKIC